MGGLGLKLPAPQFVQSPREPKKIQFDAAGEGKTTKGETKQGPPAKFGTSIDFKITFFPDKNEDQILYLKNLHMFEEDNWVSFGIKPKAKDLKSVLEDLNSMEYL